MRSERYRALMSWARCSISFKGAVSTKPYCVSYRGVNGTIAPPPSRHGGFGTDVRLSGEPVKTHRQPHFIDRSPIPLKVALHLVEVVHVRGHASHVFAGLADEHEAGRLPATGQVRDATVLLPLVLPSRDHPVNPPPQNLHKFREPAS